MNYLSVVAHLQHLDPASLTIGALGSHAAVFAVQHAVAAVRAAPAWAVGKLKDRVRALAAAGKIDAPTLRLLTAYGRATFAWADTELPDQPGAAKMAAVLDRLAAVPYFGALVRADRAGAQAILQAAYDAVKAEAKAESGAPPQGDASAPKGQ